MHFGSSCIYLAPPWRTIGVHKQSIAQWVTSFQIIDDLCDGVTKKSYVKKIGSAKQYISDPEDGVIRTGQQLIDMCIIKLFDSHLLYSNGTVWHVLRLSSIYACGEIPTRRTELPVPDVIFSFGQFPEIRNSISNYSIYSIIFCESSYNSVLRCTYFEIGIFLLLIQAFTYTSTITKLCGSFFNSAHALLTTQQTNECNYLC